MKIAIIYSILAIIATITNIATQDIVASIYNDQYGLFYSILAGTAMGLFVKYLLDKRYIFRFRTHNVIHNGAVFFRYTVMGVVTTVIFWGFEFTFDFFFQTKEMRYLGGCIGLTIGYAAKFHLDRRYVFQA